MVLLVGCTASGNEKLRLSSSGNVYFAGDQTGNNRGIIYNGPGYMGFFASSASATNREMRFFSNSSAGGETLRISNQGGMQQQFNGRNGFTIGSTSGTGAWITLDGEAGGTLASGSDYMYMEHTSTGQFEMWNGKTGVQTSKFMDVAPEGYISKPKQPSFAAYRGQSTWQVAANAEMVFNSTRHNIGGHYSTSTGRFTAPVAGSYLFTFFSIYKGSHTNNYTRIFKNGARTKGSDIHFTHSSLGSDWDNVAYSQIYSLAAGDYISMFCSATATDYHGNHWQQFCGYLLG